MFTWANEKKDGTDQAEEEERPLESDRPDFTEASSTVGHKTLQIEGGYTYTQAVGGDCSHNSHDLPELLIRYGVAERLELRVAWEGMVFDRATDPTTGNVLNADGCSDMDLGFKYAITRQHAWLPETALIVGVSTPTGHPDQSSRQVDAEVNFLYGWDLNEKLSLYGSTGSNTTVEQFDNLARFFQSACVGCELTNRLRVYNEWFALFPNESDDNRPEHYYDGGFTYLVTSNLQLDWRAGVGLSEVSDGFFTGCGFVIRR
jgi:hypothetical protein